MRIWSAYQRLVGTLSSEAGSVGKWGSLAMMILICYDVFSRYLLNRPSLISDEISAYLVVLVCFLGAADTLRRQKHISVDVLTTKLSPRTQVWLKLVTHILSLFFIVIFTWGSAIMVYHSYVRNVTMPTILLTPVWIPQVVIPIGCAILALQYVIEISKVIQEIRACAVPGGGKRGTE